MIHNIEFVYTYTLLSVRTVERLAFEALGTPVVKTYSSEISSLTSVTKTLFLSNKLSRKAIYSASPGFLGLLRLATPQSSETSCKSARHKAHFPQRLQRPTKLQETLCLSGGAVLCVMCALKRNLHKSGKQHTKHRNQMGKAKQIAHPSLDTNCP